jgi:Trk-type K+ transport system membrane component
MATEQDIQRAIEECNQSTKPNYAAIARKYTDLTRSTLSRRHRLKSTSRAAANSQYRQCLTNTQEQQLITQINRLTVRHMPPTSQIVRNMAEEIAGVEVNKNWVAAFVRRHSSELMSKYLRNIDNQRSLSEYAPMFEHFFNLVIAFVLLYLSKERLIIE